MFFNSNHSLAQWQPVGPIGGSAAQVWGNNSYLFVIMQNNGLFRSSDNGNTWSHMNFESSSHFYNHIVGINSNIVYAYDQNIYRSPDNGNNWLPSSNGLPSFIDKVYSLTTNNNVFYIIIDNGFYKSLDNGENWIPVNLSIQSRSIAFSNNNIFAYGSGGVKISTDEGINWNYINNGLPVSVYDNWEITANSNTVFIGVDSQSTPRGIFKTTNNGQNWFPSNTGLTSLNIREIYANGNSVYASTQNGMFKSSDNGNTWTIFNTGIEPINCNSIFSIGSNVFAGFGGEYNLGGLYASINGASWQSIIGNLKCSLIWDLSVKGNIIFAYVNGSGIWKSSNNGDNWIQSNNGLPFNQQFIRGDIISSEDQNIYCKVSSSIYKSSDDGNNWFLFSNGLASTPKCISTNNSKVYAGCSDGLYVSLNSVDNWSLIGLSNETVNSVDFYGNTLYAGTSSGVSLSTNNGANWVKINSGLIDTSISPLKVIGQSIYAANRSNFNGGGLYKRSVTGGDWIFINNSSIYRGIRYISSIGDNPVILLNGKIDILLSTDQGQNWGNIIQGLTAPYNFAFSSLGNYMYVATYGGSVSRRLISEVIGIKNISTEIPEGFNLFQNYPNPFNPTTNIEFSLPEKSFVKLKVFDISGKEVAELVNESLSAGTFRYEFNAENLSSGIYFYKLEAERFSETKRMILLK